MSSKLIIWVKGFPKQQRASWRQVFIAFLTPSAVTTPICKSQPTWAASLHSLPPAWRLNCLYLLPLPPPPSTPTSPLAIRILYSPQSRDYYYCLIPICNRLSLINSPTIITKVQSNKMIQSPTRSLMCACTLSCPTLCNPMDYSPPGSSLYGILQARTLEWVAMPSYKGSSWPKDRTQVSCTAGILCHVSHWGRPLCPSW